MIKQTNDARQGVAFDLKKVIAAGKAYFSRRFVFQ
jgi:hypothetical protein